MLNHLAQLLIALPQPAKRAVVLALDGLLCVLAVWIALCLRLDSFAVFSRAHWAAVGLALVLALPIFIRMGLYRAIFRYAGGMAAATVVHACLLFGVVYTLAVMIIGVPGVPRSLGVLVPLLLLLLVGGSRAFARYWLGGMYRQALQRDQLPQVVLYGAGQSGRQLAAALRQTQEVIVRGFVDDDVKLQGRMLEGLPIRAPAWLASKAAEDGITDVLLAMPSVSHSRRAEILNGLVSLRMRVRMLPGLDDLAQGRVQVNDLKEVQIEDLLGRDAVAPVESLLKRHVQGKAVLVTGAGGSIGSELCRQLASLSPSVLLLVELNEYALYAIHQELSQKHEDLHIVPLLASVCDAARMERIMSTWQPHTVYHAAAYKHVPLVEHNPAEGVRNNAFGTLTTARAALAAHVKQFVLVSTDKAVRPTNIMGASKRLSEIALQGLAQGQSQTCFSMVRFGNVLGSSGSVVPLFRQQIAAGGPITLTHESITRYFMTIPEAAQLVIQAGAMGLGGDVFLLDMGEPVRIIDLARRLVELTGRTVRDEENPHGDIELEITGLRPGEKLFEELLIEDNAQPTAHPRIMKANEPCPPWPQVETHLQAISLHMTHNDVEGLKTALHQLVPGYHPHPDVVDWVHMARAQAAGDITILEADSSDSTRSQQEHLAAGLAGRSPGLAAT